MFEGAQPSISVYASAIVAQASILVYPVPLEFRRRSADY